MHVEELKRAAREPGLTPTGAKSGISGLRLVFIAEAALFLFVAAAACKILLTPKPATISERDAKTRLVWIDKSGRTVQSLDLKGRYTSPRNFPSNASILLNKIEPSKISIWNLSPGDLKVKPMVPMEGRSGFGLLAPSGREIVFGSWKDGVVRSNIEPGRFKPSRLGKDLEGMPQDWSSDGRWIALTRRRGASDELWLWDLSSGHKTMVGKAKELSGPRFSPDSRWIAFTADFGGEEEIYRVPAPATAMPAGRRSEPLRVSPHGGHSCRWGDSVNELFYLDDEENMVAIELNAGASAATHLQKIFDVRSKTGTDYEYRFDGFGFDRSRHAFVFALAGAAKFEGD